ncbi:hypothetical protein NSR00_14380 [Aeribacillus sp. FSL K6-8394]|uniref:hypothetical protein n=1 Tax=Aeribacillus sp. FSL K6-8394 TaxID=2954570 RepID=UPI0030F4FB0C
MLVKLLSLMLSVRMQQQYSAVIEFMKKVPFLSKLSSKQYMLFSFILDILFAFIIVSVLYSWLYFPQYRQQWESGFIVFFLLYSIFKGAETYRRTHIPLFMDLIQVAPASLKSIHITFIALELGWSIFTNSSLFFVYILFQSRIAESLDPLFWMKQLNILLLGALLFITSNKLAGAYIHNIVVKKIGWVRFVFFAAVSTAFFMLGRILVSGLLIPIFKTFKDNFPSFLAAAEDTAWVNLSQQLINLYGNKINSFQKSLFSDGSLYLQIEHFIGTPWMLGSLILLLVGVLSLPVKMIPTEDHGEIKRFRDFFHFYLLLLHWVRSIILPKNVLIYKDLQIIREKRWLLSKEFFNYMLLSYEAFFYIGFFTACMSAAGNTALQIQLLFTLNLMVLANQAMEMRMLTLSFFSFSIEKRNIWMYQLSFSSLTEFFWAKLKLFYCLYLIPSFFLTIGNIMILMYFQIADLRMIIPFIGITISFFVFPFIQLYLFPFITKFHFIHEYEIGTTEEEESIVNNGQAFMRRFLVMPFIYYLLALPFIGVLREAAGVVNYISVLYFIIVSAICLIVCKNTMKKGIDHVEKDKILSITE